EADAASAIELTIPASEELAADAAPVAVASEDYWIESVPVFLPADAGGTPDGLHGDAARRRRRRGGRRGGRGRRSAEGGGGGGSAPSGRGVPTGGAASAAPGGGAEPKSSGRRRRRRGGSGRRRPEHQGRTTSDASDGMPSAAVSAPAEPPVES